MPAPKFEPINDPEMIEKGKDIFEQTTIKDMFDEVLVSVNEKRDSSLGEVTPQMVKTGIVDYARHYVESGARFLGLPFDPSRSNEITRKIEELDEESYIRFLATVNGMLATVSGLSSLKSLGRDTWYQIIANFSASCEGKIDIRHLLGYINSLRQSPSTINKEFKLKFPSSNFVKWEREFVERGESAGYSLRIGLQTGLDEILAPLGFQVDGEVEGNFQTTEHRKKALRQIAGGAHNPSSTTMIPPRRK